MVEIKNEFSNINQQLKCWTTVLILRKNTELLVYINYIARKHFLRSGAYNFWQFRDWSIVQSKVAYFTHGVSFILEWARWKFNIFNTKGTPEYFLEIVLQKRNIN